LAQGGLILTAGCGVLARANWARILTLVMAVWGLGLAAVVAMFGMNNNWRFDEAQITITVLCAYCLVSFLLLYGRSAEFE